MSAKANVKDDSCLISWFSPKLAVEKINELEGEVINPISEASSEVLEPEAEAVLVEDEVGQEMTRVETEGNDEKDITSVTYNVPSDLFHEEEEDEEEDESPLTNLRPQELGGIEKGNQHYCLKWLLTIA